MRFKVRLTPAQVKSLAAWSADGAAMADVLIDDGPGGSIRVGQGDDRALIEPNGNLTED